MNDYKIGDIIKKENKDITILDIIQQKTKEKNKNKYYEVNRLFYKYKCNICGNIDILRKSDINKSNCRVCMNKKVLKGYNDISTTHPWMQKYFKNIEDAYNYTYSSNKKIEMICPNCKNIKIQTPAKLYRQGLGCEYCSDGISYPEKLFMAILDELYIDYIYQYSKKDAIWCEKYKYDFFIKDKNCIIEINGGQHYRETTWSKNIEENDNKKELLAKNNGIDYYIKVDARESDSIWILNSLKNTLFFSLFEVEENQINIVNCENKALKSYIIEACDLWNKGLTTKEIGKSLKIQIPTVVSYLKKGSLAGICSYSNEEGRKRGKIQQKKVTSKKIAIYKNNVFLQEFESVSELARKSIELFKVNFDSRRISERIKDNKDYFGYTFKYIKDSKKEEF